METIIISDFSFISVSEKIEQFIYRLDLLLSYATTNLRIFSKNQTKKRVVEADLLKL